MSVIFLADHRLVGRDHRHVQLVDLLEFGGFGFRRAGHAGQLLVHAEVVLEGDGGQRLVLALDLARLPWLPPPGADRRDQRRPGIRRPVNSSTMITSGSFVAILDHVLAVALVEHVGAQRLLHVVVELDVGRVVKIAEPSSFSTLSTPSSVSAALLCFSSMV